MTFDEKMAVFSWRNLIIPLLETIGGKSAPSGEAMKKRFPQIEYKEYEGAAHGFFSFGKQS